MLDFDFEPELPDWSKRLGVFDLETTGLDVADARIVTACVATIDANGEIAEVREWLVDPEIEIPEAASAVHGVSTERARAEGANALISVTEIIELLSSMNRQMPLVAFNAAYDFSVLKHEALRHTLPVLEPKPVVDPLVIDRKLDKYRSGKRTLGLMCQLYGVKLENAHNSTADAVAAGRLAQRQAAKFAELNIDPLELHELQRAWADEWTLGMQEWLKSQNRPDFRAELGWPIKD